MSPALIALLSVLGVSGVTVSGVGIFLRRILNQIQSEHQTLEKKPSQSSEWVSFVKKLRSGRENQKLIIAQLIPILLVLPTALISQSLPGFIGGMLGYLVGILGYKLVAEPALLQKMNLRANSLKPALNNLALKICLQRTEPEFLQLVMEYLHEVEGHKLPDVLNELKSNNQDLYQQVLTGGLTQQASVELREEAFSRVQEQDPKLLKPFLTKLLKDRHLPIRREAFQFLYLLPPRIAEAYIFEGMHSRDPSISAKSLSLISSNQEWQDKLKAKSNIGEVISQVAQIPRQVEPESPESEAIPEKVPFNPHTSELVTLLKEATLPPTTPVSKKHPGKESKSPPTPIPQNEPESPQAPLRPANRMSREEFEKIKQNLIGWAKDPDLDPFPVLKEAFANKDPKVGELAVEVFEERLREPETAKKLTQALKSKHSDERKMALIISGYTGNLALWPTLLKVYPILLARTKKHAEGIEAWKELRLAEFAISSILRKNQLMTKNNESVLCSRCFTRGTKVKSYDWTHQECRRCGRAEYLLGGVKEVVGVLGPGFGIEKREDGYYQISLWEEVGKKFRYVDLDALEIRGGGNFDYDWGLNAVLEGLKNGMKTPKLKLKIRINGEVSLSANSQKLIEEVQIPD